MASVRPAFPLAWTAIAVVGCATQPPGDLREAAAQSIAPYESHAECLRLETGDRLDYAFTADSPVKFDLRYREGNATLMPVTRDDVLSHSGVYRVVLGREYCAAWEAGPPGAIVSYRLRRIPEPK